MSSRSPSADPVQLVRAISHELANPVSGLVGAVELLQALPESDRAKRRRYRDLAAETVAKLEGALKGLRHAAMVEGGPVRDLEEAVRSALERAGRGGRVEREGGAPGPVRVTAGARLDPFLDRWIGGLGEAEPVLRILRPHRFGVWLQSGPLTEPRSAVLSEAGSAGARVADPAAHAAAGVASGAAPGGGPLEEASPEGPAEAPVQVFFAYPLADIRA